MFFEVATSETIQEQLRTFRRLSDPFRIRVEHFFDSAPLDFQMHGGLNSPPRQRSSAPVWIEYVVRAQKFERAGQIDEAIAVFNEFRALESSEGGKELALQHIQRLESVRKH